MSYITNQAYLSVGSEITAAKQKLAAKINELGGNVQPTDSFDALITAISEITGVSVIDSDGMVVNHGQVPFLQWLCDSAHRTELLEPNFTEINDNTVTVINEPDVFQNCTSLTKVVMNAVESITGAATFENCTSLEEVQMDNLRTLSGSGIFNNCSALRNVNLPNLIVIMPLGRMNLLEEFNFPNVTTFNLPGGIGGWASYPALKRIVLPSLSRVNGQSFYGFFGIPNFNSNVESMQLGTVVTDLSGNEGLWSNLRNFEVGYGTNANINFKLWKATNVIAEGAAAIAELNTNIMNGIVANLLQGAGKTFTVGSSLYNVLYPETLQAFADKGWNIAST